MTLSHDFLTLDKDVDPPGNEIDPLTVLSNSEYRERISPDALQAFFKIMDHWKVSDKDACKLLGGMADSTYYRYKKECNQTLIEDRLLRISILIGIFRALNLLYRETLADKWMQLPNKNRMFNGKIPLEYLLSGGIPAFMTVRSLLEAKLVGR